MLYARSLGFGLVFDDADMVGANPLVASLDLGAILRSPILPPQDGAPNDLYRPAGVASLALDHWLWGGRPAGYRVTNLLLHALVTGLLFALARSWGASERAAALAAALFALHPIHSEAVLQIKGRFELLAAALGLAALLGYERSGHARSRLVVAALAFLGAVLAKESALGLVALVPVRDLSRRCDERRPPDARPAAPRWGVLAGALAIVAIALALRYRALGFLARPDAVQMLDNPVVGVAAGTRVWTALDVVTRYARLLLFPVKLAADYSFAAVVPHAPPGGWRSWCGLLLTASMLAAAVQSYRRRDGFALSALVLAAAPFAVVSNLVFPIGTIMGERLVYLPSAGLCLLAGRWLDLELGYGLAFTPRARSIAALTALTLALFAARIVTRVPDWASNWDLFQAALRVNPDSAKMLAWVGRGHLEHSDFDDARTMLERAIELVPHWGDPRVNLARTLVFLDDVDGAERQLDLAERDLGPSNPWVHYQRGLIALRRARFADAAAQFLAARRPPWEVPASFNYAYALLRAGEPWKSATAYAEAFGKFPADRRIGQETPRFREALQAVVEGAAPAECPGARDWARSLAEALDAGNVAAAQSAAGSPCRDG